MTDARALPLSPFLRLPDELIELIALSLPPASDSKSAAKDLVSLVRVNKRLSQVVRPVRWRSLTLTGPPASLHRKRERLQSIGHFVRALKVFTRGILGRAESETVAACAQQCPNLSDFSLRASSITDSNITHLLPALKQVAANIRHLDLISEQFHPPICPNALRELLPLTVRLRSLKIRDEFCVSAVALVTTGGISTALPTLEALDITSVFELASDVESLLPVLKSLRVALVGAETVSRLQKIVGGTLESLHVSGWTGDMPSVPISFPRLHAIKLPIIHRPLQLFVHLVDPTTPIKTVHIDALDDETLSDLNSFVEVQPIQTIKRIAIDTKGYTEHADYYGSEDESDGERRLSAAERQYNELQHIILPRLRRFREWSAQHGIEVVATWADQALG